MFCSCGIFSVFSEVKMNISPLNTIEIKCDFLNFSENSHSSNSYFTNLKKNQQLLNEFH
jgi:hypothetical protein